MRTNDIFLILYLLQEGVNNTAPVPTDPLRGITLPKTIPEVLGSTLILLLSSGVVTTMFSAWLNRSTLKDAKTEELNKKLADKNDELNKKDIQIEILKVRLENTEKRNQELQAENRELKEMTNTGFTRQEQLYKDHIRNLQAEIDNLKKINPQR